MPCHGVRLLWSLQILQGRPADHSQVSPGCSSGRWFSSSSSASACWSARERSSREPPSQSVSSIILHSEIKTWAGPGGNRSYSTFPPRRPPRPWPPAQSATSAPRQPPWPAPRGGGGPWWWSRTTRSTSTRGRSPWLTRTASRTWRWPWSPAGREVCETPGSCSTGPPWPPRPPPPPTRPRCPSPPSTALPPGSPTVSVVNRRTDRSAAIARNI